MELTLPLLPYLLSTFLLLLSVWFLQKRVTYSKSKLLPPGPWNLPFIGSLHHLANAGLPHHALRNLARLHGPVMLLRAGQIDLVVLTSREAAMEVLKTQDAKLANRPVITAADVLLYGGTDVISGNGSHWRQLRRICMTELLIAKQVKSFSSIRQEEIISLLKSFSLVHDKSPVKLSERTYELSNNIIYHAAFGCHYKNRTVFLEILREAMERFSGFDLSDLFPSLSWLDVKMRRKLERLRCKLDAMLEEILQEHLEKREQHKKGGDEEFNYDFVDILINVKEHGNLEEPITMDNIKAVILDVLIAGTETSSTAMTWAMTELIRHPEVMRKAQTEIRQATRDATKIDENALGYLKLVIKETLRMHPPGPLLLPRICKESCQILGYTIPSGTRFLVNAFALGRSPEYWNDPEEFRPERFEMSSLDFKGKNFEYIPFGAGRRICPGLDFASAVMEETLARLLLHFDWELPDGMKPADVDMTETFGVTAAKKEPLSLVPTLRVPLP